MFYELFLVIYEALLVYYETFLVFYDTFLVLYEKFLVFWEIFLVLYEVFFAAIGHRMKLVQKGWAKSCIDLQITIYKILEFLTFSTHFTRT